MSENNPAFTLQVRDLLADFFIDYEHIVYKYKYDRLPALKPSIHQLLHIADSLKWAGPLRGYWQFPIERQCGIITKAVILPFCPPLTSLIIPLGQISSPGQQELI